MSLGGGGSQCQVGKEGISVGCQPDQTGWIRGWGGGGAEEKISRFEVSRGWHLCLWEVSANVGWSIIPVIMTIFIAIQRQ